MSTLKKDERIINIEGLSISLKLIEEQQKAEEQSRTACFSAGFAFVVFGIILWGVLGTLAVDKIVKAYNFLEGSCKAVEGDVLVKNQSCHCEGKQSCQSIFPCVRVHVVVTDSKSNLNKSVAGTVIYNTIYDLNKKCSIGPPCKRSYKENQQAVESFINNFRNHSNIICYFNPADQKQVILSRDGHVNDLFHALFWPFLFVVAGFSMFYSFLYRIAASKSDDV